MLDRLPGVALTLNGAPARLDAPPLERLSRALRERAGLTGVKVGCNAGDCGSCTALMDGEPVCACLVTVGQAEGCEIETVEALSDDEPVVRRLRAAFLAEGAAQCGVCTPAALISAVALLRRKPRASEREIADALGGVLCRCTGYRAILAAVASVAAPADPEESRFPPTSDAHSYPRPEAPRSGLEGRSSADGAVMPDPAASSELGAVGGFDRGGRLEHPSRPLASLRAPQDEGGGRHPQITQDAGALRVSSPIASPSQTATVGQRLPRLDGAQKLDGREIFGADSWPADALTARAIRSPHDHARFTFGDLDAWRREHPGIAEIFTAADAPARLYGVIPAFADQPIFAREVARHRGEAVALIVGEDEVLAALDLRAFPVHYEPLPALTTMDAALDGDAPLLHPARSGNILTRGRVVRGEAEGALATAEFVVEGEFETGFVEHAYIEPEAGFARRVGDRLEIQACTQAPYMDRDDVARLLGLAPEQVRIRPTAVGGGFGSKLDLSVQPFLALAAWTLNRPVRMVYSRTESMASTTKRHPARIRARIGANRDGRLVAMDFSADFNTGAYASWGPTVANRVPVHASGPYRMPHYRALARAVHTHLVPAGAFRGFGVPQSALAQEQLYDELAIRLGLDRLEFRILNALQAGEPTVTGQVFSDGLGFKACLEALRPRWQAALAEAEAFNARAGGPLRRGVGVAGMWYGCGNTSMSNPSTMRAGLKPDGRIALFQGAVDIGQGSNTVVAQMFCEALGAPIGAVDLMSADTDQTPDCGKTSASRQTFVSGKAAVLAGAALRGKILRLANAGADAEIGFGHGVLTIGVAERRIDLAALPVNAAGFVLECAETYDPPTSPLDENGQGEPYAVFGSGAHVAEVEVDVELGRVRVTRLACAHDVGRAINPTLVEGQIEGGAAQGLGLALMEEYLPGRTDNLHDYLIPTIGDMPPIDCILIEDPSSEGPYGAKGIGEQALIPTAPAIFNAIHHATGLRLTRAPATPDRVRAALRARENGR